VGNGITAHLEGHGKAGGNALRAAVLGASDGLLSNFNLVMGVAGANMPPKTILLTGLAGLLAGGISMGLGEWISVQSSRELYQEKIRCEVNEIAAAPAQEAAELVLIYEARGFDEATSQAMATRMMRDPDTALDAMTRDELGIDPARLGGSAWEAAAVSFLLFMVGASIPVIPFAFLTGLTAVLVSAGVSAAGLFVVGGAITMFTGKSVLWSGLRQVSFGLVAAAVVFLIGHLVGVKLGG
jgi:VIT1/CCC1 family predicted Fe2+/Mn2+ transporter